MGFLSVLRSGSLVLLAVAMSGLLSSLSRTPAPVTLSSFALTVVLDIESGIDYWQDGTTYNTLHNRYLKGNFRPIDDETRGEQLQVLQGEIPKGLEGAFLRVGPNPIPSHVMNKRYHWFDGHGMLHAIRFHNGVATYSNQYLPTPRYHFDRLFNRTVFFQIGELFGFLGLFKMLLFAPLKLALAGQVQGSALSGIECTTANTAVNVFGNRIYSNVEGGLPLEIKLNLNERGGFNITSRGYETMGGRLDYPVIAHPKIIKINSTTTELQLPTGAEAGALDTPALPTRENFMMIFDGYQMKGTPDAWMKFGTSIAPTATPSSSSVSSPSVSLSSSFSSSPSLLSSYFPVSTAVSSWSHDMGVTRSHGLILESSVTFSTKNALIGQFFSMNHTHRMRIGVLDFHNDKGEEGVTWFTADAPYAIVHTMNAWEDDVNDDIVLIAPLGADFDGGLQGDGSVTIFNMYEIRMSRKGLRKGATEEDKRIKTTRFQGAEKYNTEFPRVHPSYLSLPTRFGYASFMCGGDVNFRGIVKFEMNEERKVASVIHYNETKTADEGVWIGGEVIPIPKPSSGVASDSVYLSTFVHNSDTDCTEWRLYDGETMDAEPVTRLKMPRRVPYGFHGEWIDQQQLMQHIAAK